MRHVLRQLSTAMMAAGVVLLADAGLTLVWQEPVSAVYAKITQDRLAGDLDDLDAPSRPELQALGLLRTEKERVALLARSLRRRSDGGDAIGRIRIPKINASHVVVEGVDPGDLRRGPGRYADTTFPGLNGTVAIAGHRTTYGAPFRRVDDLDKGDELILEMPYGRFTYEMTRRRIVKPSDYWVTRSVRGEDRLVLTACHPLYSAAERIVIFARLVRTEPLGAARRAA